MSRRFLFSSAPLAGHLDWGGYLKTAAYLVRSGGEVAWVSQEHIRSPVAALGVAFRAVSTSGWRWPETQAPPDAIGVNADRWRFQRALDVALSEESVAQATDELLEIAREFKPDVLVGEPFMWSAAIAAERLSLPYAVCGYPALATEPHSLLEAEHEVAQEGVARLNRLFDRFEVRGSNWSGGLSPWPQSPDLHVVYWTREWYADLSDISPQTQLVGGTRETAKGNAPAWFERLPHDTPLAFITLGSLFTDDPDFFVVAAHACVRAGLFPIVAMGRSDRAPNLKQQLAPRLPRCIAVAWVDFDHLFPRVAVTIHHGGMGTTHASVIHGVPQVIIPHAADQSLQARRAEANGVGLALAPKAVTLSSMQQAIETAVRDSGFLIRARNLSRAFAAAGGVARAAEWISSL